MIGTQVTDTDGVIDAIVSGRFDTSGLDDFIARHVAADGSASRRFVERFLEARPFRRRGDTLRRDVRHQRSAGSVPQAAGSPGPLALIREGIEDIRSRRRLVRYLVRPTCASAARTRSSATSGGSSTRSSRWSSTRSSSRSSLAGGIEDYPLFIFSAILPWKWFCASVIDATGSVVSAERLIKQIQFPKLVLPVAATTAGVVGFAFGMIPLAPAAGPRLASHVAVRVADPAHRGGPVRVHAGDGHPRLVRQRLLPRPAQRRGARPSPVVVPVARAVQPGVPRHAPHRRAVPVIKTLAEANPFAILFTAYRQVIYGPGPAHRASRTGARWRCWASAAWCSSASPRSCSSDSNRTSRKSCDDDTRAAAHPAVDRARHPGRRPRRAL